MGSTANTGAIAALMTLAVLSGGHVLEAQAQGPPASRPLAANDSSGPQSTPPISSTQAIDDTIEAGEADAKEPARSLEIRQAIDCWILVGLADLGRRGLADLRFARPARSVTPPGRAVAPQMPDGRRQSRTEH